MSAGPTLSRVGNRGVALVIVLWALTVISVIAANFTTANRDGLFLARNVSERAKAEALADAGVYRALLAIITQEPEPAAGDEVPATAELAADAAKSLRVVRTGAAAGADGEPAAREAGDSGPQLWRTDGTVYDWPVGGATVSISIQDEAGKIDLNAAAEELLLGLFRAVELTDLEPETLVDRLIDFRDPDQDSRALGAEDADYARAGLGFGAKDRPFERTDELRRVLGITPDIYRQVAPLITVHSGLPGVDPNVATAAVLAVLGSAGAAVDIAPGTEAPAPRTGGAERRRNRASTAASRQRSFTVTAEARTAGGAVFVRQALVELNGPRTRPFTIRQWEQARTRLTIALTDSLR